MKLKDGWPDRRQKLEVMLAHSGKRLSNVHLKKRLTGEWAWHYVSGSYLIASDDSWDYTINCICKVDLTDRR